MQQYQINKFIMTKEHNCVCVIYAKLSNVMNKRLLGQEIINRISRIKRLRNDIILFKLTLMH